MLLSCPSCTTSYQIPDDAVGTSGRKVKCHKCEHVWQAVPQAAEAAPSAGDAGEANALVSAPMDDGKPDEMGIVDAPGADHELDELRGVLAGTGLEKTVGAENDARAARPNEKPVRRRGLRVPKAPAGGPRMTAPRMAVIAAAAGLICAGMLWLRHEVVEVLPGAARLYAAVGYPVNLRGLEFHNVGFETVIENGLPVLAVRGEVVNVTGEPIAIPDISYSLRNHRMQEIYAWTGKASKAAVAPAGRVSFATRLLAPPIGAEQVQIRFVPGEGQPGKS